MRRVLIAPRIAGFAVYQRELLTDSAGNPVRGKWKPILDEATWRAVDSILGSTKSRVERKPGGLLTNIARCGKCGAGMIIARKKGTFYYLCRGPDSGGCAGVGISGPKLEAQIVALLSAYLNKEIKAPQPAWDGQARLEEVNGKIAELMEKYRTGLSGSIVFPTIRRLEDERNDLQTEQASFNKIKARKQITLTGEWDDLDLHAKREVIRSVIEAVVIRPTGRTGLYDPSRVDVIPLQ
jgi:site-specific DNA recombinase